MKEPRPALENLCRLNAQCKTYGQRGQANLRGRKIYGVDRFAICAVGAAARSSASGKARRCLTAKSARRKPCR